MTKIIEFDHRGETIRSVAVLNFDHLKCSAMVMPYEHKDELGNFIVITGQDHDWMSEASIVNTYRITYLNILTELDLMVAQRQNQ